MFLKEKRDNTIKDRGCCDGGVNQNYIKKGEMISSIFMQESLMVTFIVNAMEGCDVDTADIPGAFLHMNMVHGNFAVRARLCGVLADLFVNIDPSKFADNFFLEGGQKVI